ncbi:ATP-binding protein [Pseudomonas sp. NPDC089569]|uniref:hybrid sensor histidine kinase/response regulator n=1 Tax=Pseudomonas sp. NPDC089569 TaxID=3390722 RepID=UPI003CFBE9F3
MQCFLRGITFLRGLMNTDTLFARLARSSVRLSSGLLLSLGVVFLLVMTNARAIILLLDSEQGKAEVHFARVLENVREQEAFLGEISDALVAPNDHMQMDAGLLKQGLQFNDSGADFYEVSDSDFSLSFTVAQMEGQGEQSLRALSVIGWHLTNFYSRFWSQSHFLSPQVFVLSPQSQASIAVPAIGKFRNETFLSRKNYDAITGHLRQQAMVDPARFQDHAVHWIQVASKSPLASDSMEVAAFVAGDLPINALRTQSGMDQVMVATMFDLRHLLEGTTGLDLPFHGGFTLIAPAGEVLTGQLHAPAQNPGISLSSDGLLISVFDTSIKHERWAAQYSVGYGTLLKWATVPLLRLLIISLVLFALFRWLYRYYQTHVVVPAKTAHAQLIESRLFNQSVIESAPAGLIVIRISDGSIILENKRAEINRAVSQTIVRMLRKPYTSLNGEACMALEGRYFLVSYSSARYLEQDVLLCTFSDVTEHRQRSQALHQAKLAAEKANEAKTIFLATMSHEIRTPLYGVLGTLELLGQTELDKRQVGYLHTMQVSSSTVLQIISDVLDVSKIESGQLTLDAEDFCPLDLVEDVVSSHIAGARSKDLQIYACVDPNIPDFLHGDRVKIYQVLNNLLGNAIKFTNMGRVVLRCHLSRPDNLDPSLVFQVADTGIGITPDQQRHIFEPFYQARTSNLVSGTGLGLSICSRFVELMGGHLSVVSEEGLGSSFTVSLPFTEPESGMAKVSDIALDGRQVYVRAPARELSDNICAWLTRWGASAAVVSTRSHEMLSSGLLVDVLGAGELPYGWKGKRLICEHDGPEVAEVTESGFRVSAHHVRSIARGVLMVTSETGTPAHQVPATTSQKLELRVLVAEDNLINQAILKEQLEALGCSVILAGNGAQALQLWSQESVDVVLSDVNMPVMNGYELARAIRAKNTQVPIIGITANAMRDEGERCQGAGMDSWMVKPLSQAHLLDVLASVRPARQHIAPVTGLASETESDGHAEILVLSEAMRRVFHKSMEQDMEAIRSAVASGALEETIQKLHSVSGALSVVRAEQLSQMFGRLEHQLREDALNASLAAEIEQALEMLSRLLKSI